MSPKEKIAKLEGLLARVKERAEAPRPNGATAIAAATPARSFSKEPERVKPAPASSVTTVSEPPMEVLDAEVSYSEEVSFSEEVSVSEGSLPPVAEGEPTLGAGPGGGEDGEVDQDAETAIGAKAFILAQAALQDAAAAAAASGAFDAPAEVSVQIDDDEAEVAVEGDAEVEVDGDAEVSIDGDADVEVSTEVVELEVDDDSAARPAASAWPAEKQSGAQPVAHHAAVDEPMTEVSTVEAVEIDADAPVAELEEVHDESPELAAAAALANEVEEPAPSSSPRPIGPTVTSYETSTTYDEESAPRHTPPPESGKQVAAASVKPEPRPSSAPPPEGSTLVGGWREPGIPIPRDGARAPASTGAAPPPPPPPPPPPELAGPATAPRPAIAASAARKGPEVTRAELPADAGVAAVEGMPPSFKVSTFGDLLDSTLSL